MKLYEILRSYYFYIRNMQSDLNWSSDFDPTGLKVQSNAATTNSSFIPPSSFPLVSEKEQELMQTSFQESMGEDHSTAIWNASLNYLRNTLSSKFDQEKGLNDCSIFESGIEFRDSMCIQVDSGDLVGKNTILSYNQKRHLMSGLKSEKNLKLLLERLSEKYCEEILEEIIFIIYETWQKYLTYKQNTKIHQSLSKLLSPSFTTIDIESATNTEPSTYYIQYQQSVISAKATEAGDEIAADLFISTKLRYLNLKQADKILNNENRIQREFEILIEVIAKAVYLCCEGCFHHPDGDCLLDFFYLQRDTVSFSEREFDEQYDRFQGRKRFNY